MERSCWGAQRSVACRAAQRSMQVRTAQHEGQHAGQGRAAAVRKGQRGQDALRLWYSSGKRWLGWARLGSMGWQLGSHPTNFYLQCGPEAAVSAAVFVQDADGCGVQARCLGNHGLRCGPCAALAPAVQQQRHSCVCFWSFAAVARSTGKETERCLHMVTSTTVLCGAPASAAHPLVLSVPLSVLPAAASSAAAPPLRLPSLRCCPGTLAWLHKLLARPPRSPFPACFGPELFSHLPNRAPQGQFESETCCRLKQPPSFAVGPLRGRFYSLGCAAGAASSSVERPHHSRAQHASPPAQAPPPQPGTHQQAAFSAGKLLHAENTLARVIIFA